ncbi:hypothetical protein Emed_003930 [Eimeria media]
MTRETRVAPPAALAAARRLGSSRPLYAVSLSTALSQILHPRAAHPGGETAEPTWGTSRSEGLRPVDVHVSSAEAVTSFDVCPPQEAAGRHGEGSAALMRQWLTEQFVAQVGAHLEAALQESDLSKSDARGSSSECDSAEASDAGAENSRRYTQAMSRAALQWGLLLLLAVEHLLHRRTRQDTHPPMNPNSTPEADRSEVEDAVDAQKPITSMHAVGSSSGIAAPADSVIREALAAFEVMFRASSEAATRMLPNIVAWLDAGLLALVEEREAVAPSEANVVQVGEDRRHGQQVKHGAARLDLEYLVSQLPPGGSLSALVTSSLGDCQASGPIRRPVEHLQRTRLLGLLVRGPRVLMCSARLLAACAVPAIGIDGNVATSAPNWMPGTVPQHTKEHESSEAASKMEAEVQHRLCSQTANVICSAIRNLREALIPNVPKAASDCVPLVAPQAVLRFPERIEKTLLTAFLPPSLHWVPGSELSSSLDATEPHLPLVDGRPRSPQCKRTFGVLAAAAEDSVVEQARALLKQTDEFFVFVANSAASRLELPLAARVHCVTRLSSLALTAKHLPKAYQINPEKADSRILLTAGAAAALAQLQIAEGGENRMPRCPLTGRLNFPRGLPDEQARSHSSHQLLDVASEECEGATGGIFAYLNDEGALRMAAQVARILIALVRDITFEDDERAAGLLVPPLLRVLDIPQSLNIYQQPIFQVSLVINWQETSILKRGLTVAPSASHAFLRALMSGFPVFNEVDACFDAYLEAYTTAACSLCDGPCDQLLLQWWGYQATSIESKLEGLRTLQQLMTVGMDLHEFVPQILCHVGVAAVIAEEHLALGGKVAESAKFL